jgi:hypothetical protein
VAERSSGGTSVADVSLAAAGGALLVVGFLWGRHVVRRRASAPHVREHLAPAPPPAPPATVPQAAEDAGPSLIMTAELERLAGVAVSHGRDDPALDVFLALIGALDPLPDAAMLRPAAERIGRPRLVKALKQPGAPRAGARRLLDAAPADQPRSSGTATVTATVERPVETGRRVPELFETLLHAIRGALSLLA